MRVVVVASWLLLPVISVDAFRFVSYIQPDIFAEGEITISDCWVRVFTGYVTDGAVRRNASYSVMANNQYERIVLHPLQSTDTYIVL